MKKNSIYALMLLCFTALFFSCSKDSDNTIEPIEPPIEQGPIFPRKEMRAVWMTTAWGLDWPQSIYSESAQKSQYIAYLDKFKALNINTIYFQVKGMGDSFYTSAYEPWSAAITGTRGKDPGYDVLKFLIDEAHARNIEFHAWMNPYRIGTRTGVSQSYAPLHQSINPEWVVSHEKIQIYNPALPEVRQRLSDLVKELISKYDVDGIHFDDYFYPDPSSAGTMISDENDFALYGAGYKTIGDFRRGNVDQAIKSVYDVIVLTKPGVAFSVSPAPSNAYNMNTLYANVTKWCQEGWVDIVIPQLYQEIGNASNDFKANLGFWHQFNYKAALVIGHGFYKFGDATNPIAFQSTAELQKQFDLTKTRKKVVGNAMYSAKYIMNNNIGITDKLAEIYKNPALRPFVGRAVAPLPAEPQNVRIEGGVLKWIVSGDVKSVVYYFENLKAEGKIVAITKENNQAIAENGFYCIATFNSDNQESKFSSFVEKK